MNWDGISNVMYTLRDIITSMPDEIYELLKVCWFLFITLSVVKVLSFKEG